jgi:dihydrofolate synthase/folylpolyglutamate synthase
MGLDRVRNVWMRMGCPKPPINIVVGGTNGKGSTCAMLESILRVAGYHTGFYSSPHLIDFNERVKVAGRNAPDEALVRAFEAVETARMASDLPEPLTYFEYATLAALAVFRSERVDVGVLEVGMGGRLDAVNIVDGDVAIVTSVDLDHQAYLGDTVEEIGFEKAHIFRAGRAAICADRQPPQCLVNVATALGARLLRFGNEYRIRRLDQQWEFHGATNPRYALPMPALRGPYQLQNAAAALMALECLSSALPVSQHQVKRGLLEVEWPARMQVLPGQPTVVLDVAHNPQAARALDDALGSMAFHPNTYAVFGMLADKDMTGVIRTLKARVDHWFVAGLDTLTPRGAPLDAVSGALEREGLAGKVSRAMTMPAAFALATERAGPNDRIVVFGSFYAVAEVLKQLRA